MSRRPLAIVALALAACSDDTAASTTTLTDEPSVSLPAAESVAMQADIDAFTSAYNRGNFVGAIQYVADDAVAACGGPTAAASALSQNARITKGTVEVTEVTRYEGSTSADMRLIQHYEDAPDLNVTIGFEMVHEDGRWRFAELFPLGADSFCR